MKQLRNCVTAFKIFIFSACLYGLLASPIAVLGYQCVQWLKNGYWSSLDIITFIKMLPPSLYNNSIDHPALYRIYMWASYPESWKGVHLIFSGVGLAFVLTIVAIVVVSICTYTELERQTLERHQEDLDRCN